MTRRKAKAKSLGMACESIAFGGDGGNLPAQLRAAAQLIEDRGISDYCVWYMAVEYNSDHAESTLFMVVQAGAATIEANDGGQAQ